MTTTIKLTKAPGGYGINHLDAIDFITPVKLSQAINSLDGGSYRQDVTLDGDKVGCLVTWMGNGGKSDKISDQDFYPDKDVQVEWIA